MLNCMGVLLVAGMAAGRCGDGTRAVWNTTRAQTSRLRSFDGGIDSSSRYLATVRRATLIFWVLSIAVILLSLSGFRGFSSAVSFLISARIAVLETSPPVLVPTWLE